MSTYRLLAAVGSSFAAGPNIEPHADPSVGRSAKNYPHQLAELLGSQLVDLTVVGATTANIIDVPQQMFDGSTRPPQLDGLPAEADLVTITAGGNDLQFLGAMLYTAWTHQDPAGQMTELLRPMLPDGIPAPTEVSVELATSGLVSIVGHVRDRAKAARVVLVDYLTILDPVVSGVATTFTSEEVARFLEIQTALASCFVDAAGRTGADLVQASALSVDHALGSDAPWVQSFHLDFMESGASFHPNAEGMAAVAAEIQRMVSSERS